MISSNKGSPHPDELYSERVEVASFLSANADLNEFDLYGSGWGQYNNARGLVQSKGDTYKNYKFSFSYDNMKNQQGYITEKIFDSLVAGCVPVYIGAVNITDSVPANCFIDRRNFSSNEALYHFLKQMDSATYEQYITNIKQYLATEKAALYSIRHFVDLIKKELPPANR